MDETYDSLEDYSIKSPSRKGDVSISDTLADFEKLRISALRNAAEISHLVKEVTIGPNSPKKKEIIFEEPPSNNENKENKNEENLLEDKVSEDLRQTLLMKGYEAKLQESSEELFKNLLDKMISNRAETMRKYWKKQSEDCERKALEIRAKKLQLLKDLQENDNRTVLERAKLDQQTSQLITSQTIENMNKILEEQNQATKRFSAVTDSHTKICICYNELTSLMQTDPLAKSIADKYIPAINTVITNIGNIMDLCKTGTLSDKDVKQSEILAQNIDNIRKKLVEETNQTRQQEIDKKKQEEEMAKKKELEEKLAQEAKAAQIAQAEKAKAEEAKKSGPLFYSAKNYEYYLELHKYLDEYESRYKDLLENVNLKKFRFDCQKAVNTPVNALSSVSGSHIRDKFEKLSKLLRGERVQVLDIFVQVTQHPQGLFYVTALLAKKIVKQGDLLISSNPEAAFPLAAVTVALWAQFPEFGKLLEAYFHRHCPYLVPMFLPQKEGQTDKEFYLSRGYTYNDEGVVEKQDKFLKRMSGIFRLRCAIWIAKTPRFLNTPNPHGLRYGWQWLASFINLKPEPDISATLLHDFFNVCGSEFLKHYGRQFLKIIKLISTDYLAILQNIDEGGPKTRLEVFLQTVLKTGHIPPPSGLLPPNTW
ncbi:GLE1-like domain-containing protein [Phthorimaea operculella]|nr:GLE1-like domain-containing protein [Phthorimaea operculella]